MLASVPARVLLSPVLLTQAVQVRRRALVLPEPDGPRHGTIGQGPPLRLLITGDSSAAGVGVAHQEQALSGQLVADLSRDFTVTWRLEARTGATTAETLARLRQFEGDEAFDVAVSALGVNDVTRQIPLRRWARMQADLATLLRARFGVQRHWRAGLPPMHRFPLLPRPLRDVLGAQVRVYDRALAEASSDGLYHFPFDETRLDPSMMAQDGFHPGAPIYAAWAQELAARIRDDLR